MKKQSKRKTTSFKSSIVLLLLIAVLLITSTYAWFTANQTVTVSSLQVNVQATNGLQISVDGLNWTAIISSTDLTGADATYAGSTNQIPTELAPVSTSGSVTSGKLDMFFGNVTTNAGGDYIITATQETDTEGTIGRYIVFDMFLRVDAETTVYLTPNSRVTYLNEGTTGVDQGLQNAARIAFIDEGSTSTGSATSVIQGLNGGTTSRIWEPNYDTHTAAAVNNASNTYGITTTTAGGSLLPYYGVKAVIPASADILVQQLTTPSVTYFGAVTPTYSTIHGFSTNLQLITLNAGITKLRTYMWVEGQDVDCENGASGTDIIFDLQITSNNG